MIVIDTKKLDDTERQVKCPTGGFESLRMLVKSDNMGFSMTRTTVHPTADFQRWHYQDHLEACYCISGRGLLKGADSIVHQIGPGTLYALDQHDEHWFRAIERVELICVFNPPLVGHELHGPDGSYTAP
ncbi:MAG: ectoine synthase [Desulfuromonadales bacterium]|nr:ectoine synthase [Desulfuromonadales bacterium]